MSDEEQMAKRCAWTRDDGSPCGSWAQQGSDFCRWHGERARLAVRLVFSLVVPDIPDPVAILPQGVRLTADGVLRLAWYRDFLNMVVARSGFGGLESLPWPCAVPKEPHLVIGQGETPWRLPLAALVIWRTDGIVAAVGAINVFALAGPDDGSSALSGRDVAPSISTAGEFRFEDAGVPGGGELALRPRDGSHAPYLGFTYWAGQFLVMASPEIPWQEYRRPNVPSLGVRLPDLRVLGTPREKWATLEAGPPTPRSQTAPIPERMTQCTFLEARTMATAVADAPALRRWTPVEGEVAWRHAIEGQSLETKLLAGPVLDWLALPASHEALREELRRLEFPAVLLMHVALGMALQQPGHVPVAVDDLIRAIGWVPRREAERAEMRRKIWRWLLLFDAMLVIGRRPGRWRDPHTKADLDLLSVDALLRVTGQRLPAQPALDASAPPLEVSLVAGPWLDRFRGNREVLSDFGEIRRIAAIPAGRPAGAWAQSIGLALQQRWREDASYARQGQVGDQGRLTMQFRSFTRRDLLTLFRTEPDVEELLRGLHPERAKGHWSRAIAILKKRRIIGSCRARGSVPEGRGWQKAWLDQPLDIRPGGADVQNAEAIKRRAARAQKKAGARRGPGRRPATG